MTIALHYKYFAERRNFSATRLSKTCIFFLRPFSIDLRTHAPKNIIIIAHLERQKD